MTPHAGKKHGATTTEVGHTLRKMVFGQEGVRGKTSGLTARRSLGVTFIAADRHASCAHEDRKEAGARGAHTAEELGSVARRRD